MSKTILKERNESFQETETSRYPVPEREIRRNGGDYTAPYRTPALLGTVVAMDREYFFEIGSLDEGMNIWGSENTELSLRVRIFFETFVIFFTRAL